MKQIAKKLSQFVIHNENTIAQLEQYIGYTLQEVEILTFLHNNNLENESNIYAMDIQQKMYMSRSTVSVIIKNLVNKGLLIRQHDERNRKKTLLIITRQGDELLEQVNRKFDSYAGCIQKIFDEEKFHKLIELADEFSKVSNSQLTILKEKDKMLFSLKEE